ncbi:MAG: type III-B CRISPR module-associated Cmr3 family protein [Pseudomonadota bacterium]|nr:type III-B CRISPR module-associated Cmr3 family protein [Pseudomonadota bacterium]
MTTLTSLFIEPLDVLFLRGNQLFGEPGSYGEALMPPWPSVAAGALRSRILADDGADLHAFAQGRVPHPELGTPEQPGSFLLHGFQLARRAGQKMELLMPVPADLFVTENDDGTPAATALHPTAPHKAIATSSPLPLVPLLAQAARAKPASGWWLRESGWRKHLHAQPIASNDLVKTSELWAYDERIGIGLDETQRSASDGKLFSSRAVCLHPGVGFAVAASGARLPASGALRLGGDGRAAHLHHAAIRWPEPDHAAIAQARRCRIVLTSPGIFSHGWQLPGMAADGQLSLPGMRARVVAAAVSRAETISGWNLATWQPKPAQKAAGSGSVYWLDDLDTTPDALHKLAAHGLWSQPCEDAPRRAEGFNRFSFAVY